MTGPTLVYFARRKTTVWAYTKRGKFLGRVELNRAGLEVKIGKKANKNLGNVSWETLCERLGA